MNRESPSPMRRRPVICVSLLGLCGVLARMALLSYDYARADVLDGPLPAPRLPQDIIRLTPNGEAREVNTLRQHAIESSGLGLRKLPRS
jgi:hypothetical protein